MEETPSVKLPSSNGPRPHRCEVCQRSFREVATLRKHEQLHRADRPYVCQTCGKSFLWSSNLKVHERVHTGERPYKCKICHRCFTQSNDLRRHERNVHMRGKIYGYKTAGRHNSQVTPPATPGEMESNGRDKRPGMAAHGSPHQLESAGLHSPVRGAPPMPHGLPLGSVAGIQSPTGLLAGPYSAVKPHSRAPATLPSFSSFRPMQRSLEGLQAMSLAGRHLHAGPRPHHPMGDAHSALPHHSLRLTQEMMQLHHHQLQHNNNNNNSSSNNNNNNSNSNNNNNNNGISGSGGSSNGGGNSISSNGGLRGTPPDLSPHGEREKDLDHSRDREMDDEEARHRGEDNCVRDYSRDLERGELAERSMSREDAVTAGGGVRDYDDQERGDERDPQRSTPQSRGPPSHLPHEQRASSADNYRHHAYTGTPPDHASAYAQLHHHAAAAGGLVNALGGGGIGGGSHVPSAARALSVSALEDGRLLGVGVGKTSTASSSSTSSATVGYPCDSVMDLSINKSSNSPPSRASSTASSSAADKDMGGLGLSGMNMPPPKTPTSVGAESESEPGKRDVTTTSGTPPADSGGIHHCQHCNIFFYDYTMFHLHESLHMPYEDHPFRCPSCGTHCQDKIEFMFHTVWHVKYPHTIPNYTPFREGFLSSP
ncbi:dual specificity protein kinase splA-like, partial [Aplysia californica]|uniref:Dual specificity protein kinase splA-like n=1 Tax=Aplysia californica TaxID=6500 RepID=A0ABM1VWW9_APLCA